MNLKLPEESFLLRIFVGETEEWEGVPVYEAVVRRARELHVAGATVLRGTLGFGASSRLHQAKFLRLSEDLPMIVEMIDHRDNPDDLLQHIDPMIRQGLARLEKVQVVHYRHRPVSDT